MKILTIGIGVIGTTYSWQLQKAGFDLTHYVRKNKTDECRRRGIEIHCLDLRNSAGTEVKDIYQPNFVDDFSANNGFDYILVSVNSNQLADLLPQLRLKSGNATIVFLQNLRPGDDEMIDQFLDKTKYIIAYPFKAGGGRTGNIIETVIFGMYLSNTVLGTRDGHITPRVKTLYNMLKKANMNPQIIPNIIPYVRTHYVWAACCVAAYIKAGTYDNFKKSNAIKESYLAMREGWKICMKQGINPRKIAPTKYYYLPFFFLIPFTRWLYNKRGMREMFEGHVRHSPEEMKDMYFTLLAQGKKHGIKMPVYEGYLEYVSDYFKKIATLQGS